MTFLAFQGMNDLDENFETRSNEFKVGLLQLSENPICFEPISSLTNVFFDRDNQQIFCVRSNGVGGKIFLKTSLKISSKKR